MTTPSAFRSSPSGWVLAGWAGLAMAGFVLIGKVSAAPEAPAPSVSIIKVERGEVIPRNNPSASNDAPQGNKVAISGDRNSNTTIGVVSAVTTSKKISNIGEMTYVITLRNGSTFAAKGVVIQYHFYNKTSVTGKGGSSIPDISEVKYTTPPFDIDPGKLYEITSKPIPFGITQIDTVTTTSSGIAVNTTRRSQNGYTVTPENVTTSTDYNSSETTLLGWHIEVYFNGKMIGRPLDHPENLPDLLAKTYHYKSASN